MRPTRMLTILAVAAVGVLLSSGCQNTTGAAGTPLPVSDPAFDQRVRSRRIRLKGTASTDMGPARVRIDGMDISVVNGTWIHEADIPADGRSLSVQLLAGDAIVDERVIRLRRE